MPKKKKIIRKWAPYISFVSSHPDFSAKKYNLQDNLTLSFYNEDLWSSHQLEAGTYVATGKKNKLKLGLAYMHTSQFVQYRNPRSAQDLIDFGVSTFNGWGDFYEHRRLMFASGFRQYVFKGFFIEPSLSLAFNISKPVNEIFLGTNAANAVYQPLFNTAKNLNRTTLFGSVSIGYEYKGFFAGFFYEQNLSPVTHQFTFRGNSNNIKYEHWINRGIKLGYILDVDKLKGRAK
ncbi:MAG: hypothetical protein EAY75_10995 [Bacteroidetes bacterium]|nr:MAG: hypothetical protein EAY75_10995 [Bacteroidota bacterium]